MTRLVTTAILAAVLGCSSAVAQVAGTNTIGGSSPGIGTTSPLGMGAGSQVGPAGIPLGATEITIPGISPVAPSTSGMSTCSSSPSGMTGVASTGGMGAPSGIGSPGSSTLFDGGGTTGMAAGACAGGANTTVTMTQPTTSTSLPGAVGPVGIPLGSTELGTGGLSPPPIALTFPLSTSTPLSTSAPLATSAPLSTPSALSTGGPGVGCPTIRPPGSLTTGLTTGLGGSSTTGSFMSSGLC